ncbi:MAG: hypothetical protein JST79_19830 [Acidobacteria bacterium]|nr:hypothetical protein [Acidobacteriota bacterium]
MPSAKRPAPPRWLCWLTPSLADLLFVAAFLSLTVGSFSPRLLGDSSIGWHIRNGERMLATHTLTRVDPFSSLMQGRPWYAWEWLYDLAAGKVHAAMGLNGIVLGTAGLVALTFALVFGWASQRGVLAALLLLPFAMGASTIHLLARPHVISWLLAVLWFRQLDIYEGGGDKKRLLWMPPLMLLWVNLHGGFLLGFVLLGLFLMSAGAQWLRAGREEKAVLRNRVTWLSGTFALCGLASFVNPFGYHLHVHVYHYLSDRWLMGHIEEFQSPDFHGLAQRCFVGLLLLAFFALAVRREELRFSHLLVLLFAVFSGLYASRNLPVASLLLVLLIAPVLSEALVAGPVSALLHSWLARLRGFDTRMLALQRNLRGHLWPTLAVAVMGFACLHQGKLGSNTWVNAHFDPRHLPVGAVDYLQARGAYETVLSLDTWGGYLIYRRDPLGKVYVDDRHDLYGAEFLRNYLKIIRGAPDWKSTLDQTRVPLVLISPGSTLDNLLRATPGWAVVYADDAAVLFEKKEK